MIDAATVDRILDSVRIEEVIGDFVTLRKRGANYLGLCPFHQDKNPSMSVSSTKGIFKCFSCGKAGTAVSFVMEHEHLTYPEALRYLAKKYNIEIVEKEESAEEIAGRMRHESLQIVTEYAQKYYQDVLWNTDTGRAIGLSYFRERKFTDETIRKFGLGYAAGRQHELYKDAIQKGYKREYLLDTGLCVERDNGDLADRFFDRVMFPIYSVSGRVIAFGGRTLKSDKTVAKYVNSPETEIYNKSRSLYGLFQAKSAIAKQDKCILVEGYADVISMHQAGIENVVASSGTSLTVDQIKLIKRFSEKITVIYDGDAAGIKAALRGIDLILEEGLSVKIVLLPPEDDPDSFAKAHSRVEIEEFIEENEQDFIAFKSDILSRNAGKDPLMRSQMITDILQSISVIPDPILRNVYVDMVSERFDQKSEALLSKISDLRRKKRRFNEQYRQFEGMRTDPAAQPEFPVAVEDEPATTGVSDTFLATCEREICYYLIKFGTYEYKTQDGGAVNVAQYIRESLEEDEITFTNELYRLIYEEYFTYLEELDREMPETDALQRQPKIIRHFSLHSNQSISQEALGLICQDHPLTVKVYERSLVPEEMRLFVVVPKCVIIYKLRITEQACADIAKKIAQAQRDGDGQTVKELVASLQLLNRVKNAFSKEINRL
ncbi:MAG: DNA primase [Bacteroidales bacterium]|nr:DNA primase [Candidatus Cacconaster equifaecalis]